MTGPAVSLEDITVEFGAKVALDRVDLQLTGGSATALVGPNGSGKTTLLRVLAGLTEPSTGRVVWTQEHRVAFVLQHGASQPWLPLTVSEVIRIGRFGRLGPVRPMRRADRDAVSHAAERMEVEDLLTAQFGTLSGGQRQRVLIAQALAQQPDVLLLDEPITGLDLASQGRILDVIDEETAAGSMVIVSTHHMDEAKRCAIVVLLATRLVAAGPAEKVLTPANLKTAYGARVLSVDADGGPVTLLDEHGHDHGHH